MANDLLTKVDSTVFVCDQTGDCGELIGLDVGKGSGTFVSQTTGGIVEFSGEDVTAVDVSIDNLDQFIRENQRPVGIYEEVIQISPRVHMTPEELEMFKGHMKPAEPLKDTPIRHTREFNGESIRDVLTPKQEKLFIERFGKTIEIYKKTAKPADVERLLEGLKKLIKEMEENQKVEEEHPGEMIIMDRYPSFEETEESYLKSPPKATITREQMELLREFIITKTKALKIKE